MFFVYACLSHFPLLKEVRELAQRRMCIGGCQQAARKNKQKNAKNNFFIIFAHIQKTRNL